MLHKVSLTAFKDGDNDNCNVDDYGMEEEEGEEEGSDDDDKEEEEEEEKK